MKPAHNYFPELVYDLTACKVHCVNGELVAYVPKAWTVEREVEPQDADGNAIKIKQYRVTEWEARKIG